MLFAYHLSIIAWEIRRYTESAVEGFSSPTTFANPSRTFTIFQRLAPSPSQPLPSLPATSGLRYTSDEVSFHATCCCREKEIPPAASSSRFLHFRRPLKAAKQLLSTSAGKPSCPDLFSVIRTLFGRIFTFIYRPKSFPLRLFSHALLTGCFRDFPASSSCRCQEESRGCCVAAMLHPIPCG